MIPLEKTNIASAKSTMLSQEFIKIWSGFYLNKTAEGWIVKHGYDKYYKYLEHKNVWEVELTELYIIETDNDDSIYIESTNLLSIHLNNCEINSFISIENSLIDGHLWINNCNIKNITQLLGCSINEDISITNSSINLFVFNRCNIKDSVKILNCQNNLRLNLINSKVFGDIEISNSKIIEFTIRSYSVIFGKIESSHNEFIRNIDIQFSIVFDFVVIKNCIALKLDILNTNFFSDIHIYNMNIDKGLSIVNSSISGKYLFVSSTIKSRSGIHNTDFYNWVVFENNNIDDSLEVIDCKFKGGINLRDGALKKVNISGDSLISVLKFQQTTPITLNIFNAKINKLLFTQTISHKDTIIHLVDCTVQKVFLSAFVNSGYIMFNSLRSSKIFYRMLWKVRSRTDINVNNKAIDRSVFSITNSDAGKTQFIDCNLREFKRFEFSSSKMVDMFVAGTIMPDSIAVPESRSNKLAEQRLGYAQLKKIHDNRGDSVTALEYLAKELSSYRKSIKNVKGTFWERLNLFLNEVSNKHNTDYSRALLWTLSSLIVFFTIYCRLVGYRFGSDWNLFGELVSRMFEFLNPVRKSDFLVEEGDYNFPQKIPFYARIWDYTSRIFISYFAYQTIQAFRKHVKN